VFLELIIGPACSLVFENEAAEPDVMQRPPRDPRSPLFAGRTLLLALAQGTAVLFVVLAAYGWVHLRLNESEARAFAYCTLVVGNLALMHANRAQGLLPGVKRKLNGVLWIVTGVALVVLMLALYLPPLSDLFRFAPVPFEFLALACGLGIVSVLWQAIAGFVRKSMQ
jgi:Ca2+-transporting ATPase